MTDAATQEINELIATKSAEVLMARYDKLCGMIGRDLDNLHPWSTQDYLDECKRIKDALDADGYDKDDGEWTNKA